MKNRRRISIWPCCLLPLLFSVAISAAELPPAETVSALKLLELHAFTEGIVFDDMGRGYVSHGDRITQFTMSQHGEILNSRVWATTGEPAGHKILADGTHLVCDAERHAVLLLAADGTYLRNAADTFDGQRINSPNDLTLDLATGGFYFTNPGGLGENWRMHTVHYVDETGVTHRCDGEFAGPNGIALSADGKRLFIAESYANRILECTVKSPGKLGERRVFAELPKKGSDQVSNEPDGICLDVSGNLYVAHYGMKEVQVLDPNGKLIRRYPAGNLTASNVAFGGPNRDQLFITGGLTDEAGPGGLFRLDLGVKGSVILPK